MLDDFRNDDPRDYRAGFPWHPHRGIETITYVLAGTVNHGDNLGNVGALGAGDVQWMTAGRGILHQEMPKGDEAGRMHGFQLWANLPSSLKMTTPRYQDVTAADIPEITDDDGTHVRVVCGDFWGKTGPVDGIAAEPRYLDVSIPADQRKTLPVKTSRARLRLRLRRIGLLSRRFRAAPGEDRPGRSGDALVLGEPVARAVRRRGRGRRAGRPRRDPFFCWCRGDHSASPSPWRGPIVMNTDAELRQAYEDLRNGTFIQEP